MQVAIKEIPFQGEVSNWGQGKWPFCWVECPDADKTPVVTAFRLHFTLEASTVARIHVTANERYKLYLDGEWAGCGSERGDKRNWFFESYDLSLTAGAHILVAVVWAFGGQSPFAQISLGGPCFLLAPEGKHLTHLGTGVGAWESKVLPGYEFLGAGVAWGTGTNLTIGPDFAWGVTMGQGGQWRPVKTGDTVHSAGAIYGNYLLKLTPAILPPMLQTVRQIGKVRLAMWLGVEDDQHACPVTMCDNNQELGNEWGGLFAGKQTVNIPAWSCQRVLVDLEDYYCAYPLLTTSGGSGAFLRVNWAESLFEKPEGYAKGNRDAIEGKFFHGVGDIFKPDGGKNRSFETLWWQAGRYLEILVRTAEQPLVIESFRLRETRYPLELQSRFTFSDMRMEQVVPILFRTLQMCAHETYMDCPYYEQLMYVGDTRLEALTTYATSVDCRLPAKALRIFDSSRVFEGLTASRAPSRVIQIIPGFSLWWIAMIYDYALWRGNKALVRQCMPGVRSVLDHFLAHRTADGVICVPDGWHFVDWVQAWKSGIPPAGSQGVCGILNWHLIIALNMAASLEEWLGEDELAARDRRLASAGVNAIRAVFWDSRCGLFADDTARKHWSEHAQCLAVLSGMLPPEEEARIIDRMLQTEDLARTTIYFTHYLFEALARTGRIEPLFQRLDLWFSLAATGFKTAFEAPGDTRSDCHAWGAHPLYHYYASILGVRPTAFGFERAEIHPQLGPLTAAGGRLVHPCGMIELEFRREGRQLTGRIALPEGLKATFVCGGKRQELHPGMQEIGGLGE